MKILIAVSILNMKHFEQPIILVYGKREKKRQQGYKLLEMSK